MRLKRNSSSFWAFVMPGGGGNNPDWTLRTHWFNGDSRSRAEVEDNLIPFMNSRGFNSISWYDVESKRRDNFVGQTLDRVGEFLICNPSQSEAMSAESLHRTIWNVADPAFLYPFDLYHPDSGLATQLVLTHNSKVIGFLFGFYAQGKDWLKKMNDDDGKTILWVESQLLGIDSEYRRHGLAKKLKLTQKEIAAQEGIHYIHWTVDTLQAANAHLNFNQLGGVAMNFYPDYYVFRNDLNRVSASRIGITWVINSQRVNNHITSSPKYEFRNLHADSAVETVNPVDSSFDAEKWTPRGDTLLIQIPSDWNSIQKGKIEVAQRWRSNSDAVFGRILGIEDDKYALSGIVANREREQTFLIAKRSPRKLIS